MRRVFLWAARNRWLKERLPRFRFMRRAVRRFMPGETLEDALAAALPLQAAGIGTMYTRLGENLEDLAAADEVADHYLDAIDKIVAAGITGEVSVKPTQLGLDLDADVCLGHLVRIAEHAAAAGSYLWIDMEGSAYVERDDRPLREAPRDPAADGDLPPGLPAADGAPTSSGCCRSTRRSAWSRAPTTRRRRSPTGPRSSVDANYVGLAVRFLLDSRDAADPARPRHPRRRADRADRRAGRRGRDRPRRVRGRDAVRHPDRPAVPAGEGGLSRPGAHRLRRALVSVVHASARRAAGERVVRAAPDAALSRRSQTMRIAARMGTIGTESAFEVSARARALEAQGRSIVHLQLGEPDFDTPANVREAAKAALDAGATHYPPFAGHPALREAIAADASARKGFAVEPFQVFVTVGGKGVMLYAILGLVDPGDEVLVPDPGYPIYESLTRFVGATPVPIPIRMANDFRLDVDELASLITPKTHAPGHQLAGQPDRWRADPRRPRADRRRSPSGTTCGSSPTRSTAGSCTTAPSTSRSRRCPGWPSGRSSSTASPRPSR